MHPIKPFRTKALAAALACAASILPTLCQAATIGKSLESKLRTLGAGQSVEVIVSFKGDGPLTPQQVSFLDNLGLNGIYLKALPMAGVLATPSQIAALNNAADVRSIWFNEKLVYDNEKSTFLTGVDRLRADSNLRSATGLPYSGKGVGVLVNDSGVDGDHPDIRYGTKVVQNVAAQFNLHSLDTMLPITWVEGVPDTDIAGGHGSHVSGIIGGTGSASGGQQEGVAPGAHIVGYGSGAGLFILDTLGAFDYALVNQFRYNIRVVANSFGNTDDTGTAFNADDPTNIATKKLVDRNFIVVISAGNSGSGDGTITGNFKKAPWIVTVGAGDSHGNLADFSSRGVLGGGGTVTVDGETFTWKDRPNVVAPGVDVISVRAKTDPLSVVGFNPEDPANSVYYQALSGTSMASPHVSGTVALMLEANPQLNWRDVIDILEDTATNMPGRQDWEVGAGYVNAYAAVTKAAGRRKDLGATQSFNRTFNAKVHETRIEGPNLTLAFNPVLTNDVKTFTVASGLSTVTARANVGDNTVAIVLTDPDGNRYGSAISLPALGQSIGVTAPAVAGVWTAEVRGIGSVSGVALDPLGVTNGTAVPGNVNVDIDFFRVDGFTGLNDIAGHPARGIIERAVAERLLDGRAGGRFEPNAFLTRRDLVDYLTLGGALRQYLPTNGAISFTDTRPGLETAAAEAATARGAALRDLKQVQNGVVKATASRFDPNAVVTRADLAYSLVQALGFQAEAEAARAALEDEPITVAYKDERVPLSDDASVPAALRGYVQLALDLQLMNASFSLSQGPFDLTPKVSASFSPAKKVDRANYAFSAVNLLDRINQDPEAE